MKHFHKSIYYDKDNSYKVVIDELYRNEIFDDNNNEIYDIKILSSNERGRMRLKLITRISYL